MEPPMKRIKLDSNEGIEDASSSVDISSSSLHGTDSEIESIERPQMTTIEDEDIETDEYFWDEDNSGATDSEATDSAGEDTAEEESDDEEFRIFIERRREQMENSWPTCHVKNEYKHFLPQLTIIEDEDSETDGYFWDEDQSHRTDSEATDSAGEDAVEEESDDEEFRIFIERRREQMDTSGMKIRATGRIPKLLILLERTLPKKNPMMKNLRSS